MATQLFLRDAAPDTHKGHNNPRLDGTSVGWVSKLLSLSRGGGTSGVGGTSTVTGPTVGIDSDALGPPSYDWISAPVAADVTISGTITANIWAWESSMNANVAINVVIDVIRATDNSIVQIAKSTNATEAGTSNPPGAATNFTSGMTSGAYSPVTINRGDRIRVRTFGDDAGTMASGFTFSMNYSGATAGANGDSYIQFTENIFFESGGSFTRTLGSGPGGTLNFGQSTLVRWATGFLAEKSLITQVTITYGTAGSPTDNIIVELQTDSAGLPSGTVVSTIATVPAASLPAGAGSAQTYSGLNIPVSVGTRYWIVLRRDGALSNTDRYIAPSPTTLGPYTTGAQDTGSGSWASAQSFNSSVVFDTPTGTTLYLTNTASDVSTASNDLEAWTSRGGGSTDAVTNTVAGFTAPVQVTGSAGGTVIDWFSRPLQAFILTGMAQANIRGLESSASANVTFRCEIARVDNDGTNATVWSSWCVAPAGVDNGEITTGEDVRTCNTSGDDLAFTDGQRIRIRMYLDDISTAAMASGFTATLRYGGSALGSGDTYVTLPVTVAEFISGPQEYPDSAIVSLDLQSSGIELWEAVDTATVFLDLIASGSDVLVTGAGSPVFARMPYVVGGTAYQDRSRW